LRKERKPDEDAPVYLLRLLEESTDDQRPRHLEHHEDSRGFRRPNVGKSWSEHDDVESGFPNCDGRRNANGKRLSGGISQPPRQQTPTEPRRCVSGRPTTVCQVRRPLDRGACPRDGKFGRLQDRQAKRMRVSSSTWADSGPPFQRVVGNATVCKRVTRGVPYTFFATPPATGRKLLLFTEKNFDTGQRLLILVILNIPPLFHS